MAAVYGTVLVVNGFMQRGTTCRTLTQIVVAPMELLSTAEQTHAQIDIPLLRLCSLFSDLKKAFPAVQSVEILGVRPHHLLAGPFLWILFSRIDGLTRGIPGLEAFVWSSHPHGWPLRSMALQ